MSGNKFPNLEYLSITRNPSVPDLTDFYFTEKESESNDNNILEDEKVDVEVEIESNDKNKKSDFNLGIKSIFSNFMTQNSPNTTKKSSSEENIKTNLSNSESITVINSEISTNLIEINTKNESENSNLGDKTKNLNFEKSVNKSFSSFSFLSSFTSNNKVDDNDNNNNNNNNKNDLNNRFGSWTDLGQEHVHDSTYSLNSVTTNQLTIGNDNCDQKIQKSNNNNDDDNTTNSKTNHIISNDNNNNNNIVNDIDINNSININEDKINNHINTSNNDITNIDNSNKDEINIIHNTPEKIDANYISFDDISDFKSKIKINPENVSWKEENENDENFSIDIKMKNNTIKNNNNNNDNFNNKKSNINNNIMEKTERTEKTEKEKNVKIDVEKEEEKEIEMEKKLSNVILNIDRKSYRKAVLRMLPNLKILDDGKITNTVSIFSLFFLLF